MKDVLIATLAAQVFALPIILYHFQRLSLVMPLANALVLPAQPMLMGTGAAALVAGTVWLPLGQVAGWISWLFLTYTIRVVEFLALVPFASVDVGRPPLALLGIYYAAVFGVLWARGLDGHGRRTLLRVVTARLPTKFTLAMLLLVCLLVWAAVFSLPDGLLHVTVLDVGQGDAILVTSPSGRQVLIDGGASPAALLSGLGASMPFWDRDIDLIVLSHPDEDHLLGLVPLLDRYRIRQAIDSVVDDGSAAYSEWRRLLSEQDIAVQRAHAGMHIDLGDGAYMEVLHPASTLPPGEPISPNDASTVLRLAYGEVSFLFTGDLEEGGEQILMQSGRKLSSTVLKVSHHGAGSATTGMFLEAVAPQLAVISVGENRFGHPATQTLERLAYVPVLRTDTMGRVDIWTDGTCCWSDKSP
jgi:competence protein ComEC